MIEILERSFETAGLDEQSRVRYTLSAAFYRERDSAIGGLFRYWNAARVGHDELPRVSAFEPQAMLPEALAGQLSWIDTRPENPGAFVMRNHLPSPIAGFGVELNDKPLTEHPNMLHARACMFEYLCCKRRREPMYHEIEQVIGGVARHYLRLLVPVIGDDAGGGEIVSRVYYTTRALRQPKRLAMHEADQR